LPEAASKSHLCMTFWSKGYYVDTIRHHSTPGKNKVSKPFSLSLFGKQKVTQGSFNVL